MPTPKYPKTNPEKITLYAQALAEVRMRLRSIKDIADSGFPDRIKSETCHLQLRLAAECFAIGMLAAQGDFKTHKAFRESYSPIEIFKELETGYPHFFPIPSIPRKTSEGHWFFDDVGHGDCITRAELEGLWKRSGDHLHRTSLKKYLKNSPAATYKPIYEATERLWNLVRSHRIFLSDHSSHLQIQLGRDDDTMLCFYIHLDKQHGTARIERYNIELEDHRAP